MPCVRPRDHFLPSSSHFPHAMPVKIIAVVGATGNQGSGVVSALLSSTSFSVRAISSNPTSAKAQAFLDKHRAHAHSGRLTIVKGDLNSPQELSDALSGTQGLFAALPFMVEKDESGTPLELKQGQTLVDAAKVRLTGGSFSNMAKAPLRFCRPSASSTSSTPAFQALPS